MAPTTKRSYMDSAVKVACERHHFITEDEFEPGYTRNLHQATESKDGAKRR